MADLTQLSTQELLTQLSDEDLKQLASDSGIDTAKPIEKTPVQEPAKANLLQSLLAGTVKGGASTLDIIGVLENAVTAPFKTKESDIETDASGRVTKVNLPSSESTFFGGEAKRAREYARDVIPKREGVLSKVVEGAAQVPTLASQVGLLGGGTRGLALLGALEGAKESPSSALSGFIQNAAMGQVLKGLGLIKPALKSTSKVTPLLTGATRATAGAALFGGTSAISGEDGDDIAAQAILGGTLAVPVSKGKNLTENIKNFIIKTNRPALRVKALETLKSTREKLQEKAIGESRALTNQAKTAGQAIDIISDKKKEEVVLNEMNRIAGLEAEKVVLSNDLIGLEGQINQMVKDRAVNLQPRIMEMFISKSSQYGEKFDGGPDSIVELANKKALVKRGDVHKILVDSKNESIFDADIQHGRSFERINQLIEKYKPEQIEKDQPVMRDIGEKVDFKEFADDIRSMNKTIEWGKRPTPESIPGHIFKSKVGDFLVEFVPEYKDLQADYSRVIKAMNRVSKSFDVYKGEFQTETAEATIRKILEGKTSGSLDRAISFLERGTGSFPGGLGDFLGDIKSTGKVKTNYERRIEGIDSNIRDIESSIKDQKKLIESQAEKGKSDIADALLSKLQDIDKKFNAIAPSEYKSQGDKSPVSLDKRIERARDIAKKIGAVKRVLVGVVGGGIALTAIEQVARKPIRNLLESFGKR